MSVRTTQVYSVPLVYHDTDANQTLEQVVEALQQLDRVTTGVFGRVAARADATRRRLTDLSTVSDCLTRIAVAPLTHTHPLCHLQRIADCEAKVDWVATNNQRANRIAATAKYPSKESK